MTLAKLLLYSTWLNTQIWIKLIQGLLKEKLWLHLARMDTWLGRTWDNNAQKSKHSNLDQTLWLIRKSSKTNKWIPLDKVEGWTYNLKRMVE